MDYAAHCVATAVKHQRLELFAYVYDIVYVLVYVRNVLVHSAHVYRVHMNGIGVAVS